MTGNIETAAQTIASALVYLADTLASAIRANGFFSQKATFYPNPNVPDWTLTDPRPAQPYLPYPPTTTPSWPNQFPRITCGGTVNGDAGATCFNQADGATDLT